MQLCQPFLEGRSVGAKRQARNKAHRGPLSGRTDFPSPNDPRNPAAMMPPGGVLRLWPIAGQSRLHRGEATARPCPCHQAAGRSDLARIRRLPWSMMSLGI